MTLTQLATLRTTTAHPGTGGEWQYLLWIPGHPSWWAR